MIDLKAFWKYLMRFKWILIMVPLLCLTASYFLLKQLPNKYRALARISTGFSDRSQEILAKGNLDYYQISQQFSVLIESIQAKRQVNALGIKLMLHDLEHPESPFTPYPKVLKELSDTERMAIATALRHRLQNRELVLPVDSGRLSLYTYLKASGYHDIGIYDNLRVNRHGETDQINILYESKNPYLSAFVVNTLAEDFIQDYHSVSTSSEQAGLAMLDSVLREKEQVMNEKNALLRQYKASSGVVNVGAQADVLFKQISEAENRRAQTLGEIESLTAAIRDINRKLADESNDEVNSSVSTPNAELVRLNREIEQANQRLADNGFPADLQRQVDSLQQLRSRVIASLARQSNRNPQAIRQSLIQERNNLEIQLSKARNSIGSIESNIAQLRARYSGMMPADVGVQQLEMEAQLAEKEYSEALDRYNQATFAHISGLKLRIVERGYPGLPEPSKKVLYLGLSGFASGTICVAVFLLLFMFDDRIASADQLIQRTGKPVIGSLNRIRSSNKDLRDIWENETQEPEYSIYQDLIRSIRFEIGHSLLNNGNKVLGITSLRQGEGKTFVTSSLAYAFALIGKKVLLIGDGTADLTSLLKNGTKGDDEGEVSRFEQFLVKKEIKAEDLITVLNRDPNNRSILELKEANNLIAGFDVLRQTFDIILIDIDSLRNVNKAKEWLMFTDKSLAVYKWGTAIGDRDRSFLQFLTSLPNFGGWIMNQVSVKIDEAVARS